MSWLGGYKPSTSKISEAELKEARDKKLAEDRLIRAQQREKRYKQLLAANKAQEEAKQALKDFLAIDPDLFQDLSNLPKEEIDVEELLEFEEEVKMANFDTLNEDNGADAIKNLGQIKVSWDGENPQYFFQKLETELQIYSINKQFTKRQALIRCLPDEVAKEFMHLVTLQETAAGTQAYKTLKDSLIKAYGPRPGDAFQRAMARVMVSKPSVLLKLLINDICDHNLNNCCCHRTVWGLFQTKIPMYLKNGLADENFESTTMHRIMDKADNIYAANQVSNQVSAVETPIVTSAEVAAVGRGGRGNSRGSTRGTRGGRGRGRGARGAQNGPDPRGKRHDSNPPWNSCGAHWVYYDQAFKCQSPTTCPLKDKVTPKA